MAGSTVERRQRLKRYLLLLAASIAALAVVLPATAGAVTFRGAVVAKDAARKALVTASSDGTVRTVRLHAKFVVGADLSAFHVGDDVTMKCKLLGGGLKLKLLESASAHYEWTTSSCETRCRPAARGGPSLS